MFSEIRCGRKQRTGGIRNKFSSQETGRDGEGNKCNKTEERKTLKEHEEQESQEFSDHSRLSMADTVICGKENL